MNLKMIGLIGALVIATPVAAFAVPANGLSAQTATTASSIETNAAATPGTTAKIDKVWWRGGRGWRGYGWRGYGFHRFGYGYGGPLFHGYYGYGRPLWHRRYWY